MIKTILLLHFLIGAIFPFIAKRTYNTLTNLKHNSEWLNNGYIHHRDYRITQYNVLVWLGISTCYLCLYAFVVYISTNLLYTN